MVNDFIKVQEPATSTKLLQAVTNTVSGNSVTAEGIYLVHPTTGANLLGQATKANSLPVTLASDQGNLPVSIQGIPQVPATQGSPAVIANRWPVIGTDGTNTESYQPDTSTLATGKVGIVPMGFDVATGFFAPIPLIGGQTAEAVAVSIQGSSIGVLVGKESGSGSLSSVGSIIIINTINAFSGAIGVTGTFTGTIIFEASDPTTFNWFQIPVKRVGRGDWVNSITGADSPGFFTLPRIPGASQIRARATAFSGATAATFNTYADASPQTNVPNSAPPGLSAPPEIIGLGVGSPGGGFRALQADLKGQLLVSEAGPDKPTTIPPNFISPNLPWYTPLNPGQAPINSNPLIGYQGYRTFK